MYSLAYSDFVMPLVNAVKELSSKIDKLETINAQQQKMITDILAKFDKTESKNQENADKKE